MATAMARGLIAAGFSTRNSVRASDVVQAALANFVKETGAQSGASNADVVKASDIVILAVKPQQMAGLLSEINSVVTAEHLVVSIAAGIPLATLSSALGEERRVVRVMPNTPCLVGAGALAFARGGGATPEDARLVEQLLSTVGIAFEVSEGLLDAVTGLSGSGPAYIFQVIEALSDGGVRMGLPRDIATRLTAQTVFGAAKMVLETGEHPGVLKDAVASPGGTTIAGLQALENGGLRGCLMNAVQAATQRSRELGGLS